MAILITAGSSATAFKVQRLLNSDEPCFFGEHSGFPVPSFMKDKFLQIPEGNDPTFIHQLLTICLDHGISKVYPLRRNELFPLAEGKLLFEEFGIHVFVPGKEILAARLPLSNHTLEGALTISDAVFLHDGTTGQDFVFTAD